MKTMGLFFRIIGSFPAFAALACALPAWAGQPTIVSFDPAGSIQTSPAAINPQGAITGVYGDSSGMQHGFVLKGGG